MTTTMMMMIIIIIIFIIIRMILVIKDNDTVVNVSFILLPIIIINISTNIMTVTLLQH